MLSKEQIRAGRAMLNWSQKELARRCGDISEPTIKLIELGKIKSTEKTLNIVLQTFEDAGLEFLPQNGVRFRDDLLTVFERIDANENVFLKLLDDVYYTLKGTYGELLYSFVDNSISPDEVVQREMLLRKDGISMRSLVRHGDTHLIYPLNEYRWLPKGFYLNNPTLVYADKFAVVIQNAKTNAIDKVIIIHDAAVAAVKKKEFEIIWSTAESPPKTTAGKTHE